MKLRILFAALVISFSLTAQIDNNLLIGKVSFISSQNVYVQFVNTEAIQAGDTLFFKKAEQLTAGLIVKDKSSISCVCSPINSIVFALGTEIFAHKKVEKLPIEIIAEKSKEGISVNDQAIETIKTIIPKKENETKVDGRISVSSYSNITNNSNNNFSQRLRYSLSLNATRIANTALSAETNMSFTHKTSDAIVLNDALKIYNLALNYDFKNKRQLSIGRKINASMANIGAVDGIQYISNYRNLTFGALLGSRPDIYNYGINFNLFQYGAFIGHEFQKGNGQMKSSVAIFNQTNNFITDRRFAYIQHSNSLLKNLDFFGSAEIDLYGIVNNSLTTKFDLTSTYLALKYRPINKLSLALTYDARKNIYYYETYKNYIDSLMDKETRQGLKFRVNYRPFGKFMLGGNAGYRLSTERTSSSLNAYGYLTYTQLPWINASLTLDATLLKSDNINGKIYGATISRDFINSKLYADLSYQYVDYLFNYTTSTLNQHIAELSISYRISKKLLLSANLEATLDSYNNQNTRLFINITQRF